MLRNSLGLNFIGKLSKININPRNLSAHVNLSTNDIQTLTSEAELKNALPYEKVPGPHPIKAFLNFIPGGKYHNLSVNSFTKKLREEYGPIVKMTGILGMRDTIFVNDPTDFEKVYRTEGKWPVRRGTDSFTYFRTHIRPDLFQEHGGLATEQGEKWSHLRTLANPIMLKPQTVMLYVPSTDEITRDFCDRIRQIRNEKNEVPTNFYEEISKWSMESIAYIALDTRLGLLRDLETSNDGRKLIKHIRNFFDDTYRLEVEPSLWRYISTPTFRRQMKTIHEITNLCMSFVNRAVKKIESRTLVSSDTKEESVLEKLLKIDRNAAIVMATDMLIAGVDTTGSVASAFLYAMAKNPEKQEKLREEIIKILPDKDKPLRPENLRNMPYLRACYKETNRLHSILLGNFRATGQDIVLKGYRIPKGTNVSMDSMSSYLNDEVYPMSKQFIPERWLADQDPIKCPSAKTANPFIYLPFGFGPRTCIGKRFAEIEAEILMIRLLKSFKIEWHHEDLKFNTKLLTVPADPLKFTFIDIDQ